MTVWDAPESSGRGEYLTREGLPMKHLILLLLGGALGACATPPPPSHFEPYLKDGLFAASAERVSADDLFALSEAMKLYINVDIARELRSGGFPRGLVNALYRHDRVILDYDSAITRTAAQAFDARKGNCLSLVIMTAAFAKELGLRVTYQTVATEESWSRSDDMLFYSTHVNLSLGRQEINSKPGYDPHRMLTIDFLPEADILGRRTRSISEDTVVAMYMNNRAAEALARQQIDEAYWWVRGAIVRAPNFSNPYNTLGVVYLRHGDLHAAEQVLTHLLDRNPQDRQALSNLSIVLDGLGRTEESKAVRARLARSEPYRPYHFFLLGRAAMQRGDFQDAKSLFAKEVDRAKYNSEFHFWLGIANFRLGEMNEARKQLAIAVENSTTGTDHELYAAKLQRLRSYDVH
jgi:Flp pilus assembly protein TadD